MHFLLRPLLVAHFSTLPPAAATAISNHSHGTADASHGVHGMALFGGSVGLFASHLPLFRPPHDRRILLRLEIADPAVDGAVRARLASKPALWTIEPERFALSRLNPQATDPLKEFRATLVEGHFERGGRVMYRNVLIRVVEVVENTLLAPRQVAPARLTYRALGRGRTWFLVKVVDARPDFDHIVALAPSGRPKWREVTLPRHGLEPPSLAALGKAVGVRATANIYFETDDLK